MAARPAIRYVLATAMVIISLAPAGCQQEDQAIRQWNRQSTDRILQQNDKLVEASQQLVEADAQARREMADLQRELQQERVEMGRQRDLLEEERKDLAGRRHREPILAAVIQRSVGLLACCLLLVLCWYLLHGLRSEHEISPLEEMLTVEFVAEDGVLASPARLTPPPAPDEDPPALISNETLPSD